MASTVESLIRKTVTKGVEKIAEFNRERLHEDAPNPFLTGIHTPMHDERTITELRVTGTIPAELDGRYVVIYSKYDISCALEHQASLSCDGYIEADAARASGDDGVAVGEINFVHGRLCLRIRSV